MLSKISDQLARVELAMAALMAATVTLLILFNILTRSLGMAVYWVDEAAIYAMVWTTFLATSVILKKRQVIAVTIIADSLDENKKLWLRSFSDLMILIFGLSLIVLCLKWLEPIALIKSGFDVSVFQMETFNFVYAERTNTLGMLKIWPWIILPFFSLSLTIHALNNFLDTLKNAFFSKGEGL